MYKFIRITGIAVSLVATPVWAEKCVQAFDKLDKDKDGHISHEEAYQNEKLLKYWDKLDADRNGSLTAEEYAKAPSVIVPEESRKTDHPQEVQQFDKEGDYIPPEQQIERNQTPQ